MDYRFHPLANVYPYLDDDALEALAADIAQRGQELPILLWHDWIIDGRSRYLACCHAGIEPIFEDRSSVPEDELEALIASLNEHRRHLSEEWLQQRRAERITRVARARSQGASLRSIAEEQGVSEKQVRLDLKKSGAEGYAPDGKALGKDGKHYPAKRKKATSLVENGDLGRSQTLADLGDAGAEGYAPETSNDTQPPAPLTDSVGMAVPEALREVWQIQERFAELARLLRQAQKLAHEIATAAGGDAYRTHLACKSTDDIHYRYSCVHIANALKQVRFSRPYACACPYCVHEDYTDEKCRACLGQHWVVEQVWANAPEDYRAEALAAFGAPAS